MDDYPGDARINAIAFTIGNYGYVGTGHTITLVVKQYVPDMFHVNTNLMSTSGFKYALHQSDPTPQASCSYAASYRPGCLGCRW